MYIHAVCRCIRVIIKTKRRKEESDCDTAQNIVGHKYMYTCTGAYICIKYIYIYIHVRKLRGEKVKKKSQEVRNDSGGKKVNKKIHVNNT